MKARGAIPSGLPHFTFNAIAELRQLNSHADELFEQPHSAPANRRLSEPTSRAGAPPSRQIALVKPFDALYPRAAALQCTQAAVKRHFPRPISRIDGGTQHFHNSSQIHEPVPPDKPFRPRHRRTFKFKRRFSRSIFRAVTAKLPFLQSTKKEARRSRRASHAEDGTRTRTDRSERF